MRTCPDCRYCDPATGRVSRQGWPNPARWFEQPCPQCSHRLKVHDPCVPWQLTSLPVAPAEPDVEHAAGDR